MGRKAKQPKPYKPTAAPEAAEPTAAPEALLVMARTVKHSGVFYKTGSECPGGKTGEYFKSKGFVK